MEHVRTSKASMKIFLCLQYLSSFNSFIDEMTSDVIFRPMLVTNKGVLSEKRVSGDGRFRTLDFQVKSRQIDLLYIQLRAHFQLVQTLPLTNT